MKQSVMNVIFPSLTDLSMSCAHLAIDIITGNVFLLTFVEQQLWSIPAVTPPSLVQEPALVSPTSWQTGFQQPQVLPQQPIIPCQ